MRLIDLTCPVQRTQNGRPTVTVEERRIPMGAGTYTGIVYHFSHDSMVGTYLDLPGHIKETDDGLDAAGYPLEKLYRVPATVLRLDRESGSGGLTARELAGACPPGPVGGALVLNALGARRFDEIAPRSVWLDRVAVRWIIGAGAHLLVSDVYERAPELLGIFHDLFAAGVATVCCPVNLHLLTAPHCRLTALPARFESVTQLPCRLLAEVEED